MSGGGDDGLHEEHEEHVNHEAWVIPYADLLTLLMAMFIALFAMSTVDMEKFKELSLGFNEALGGGELEIGSFEPTEGGEGPLDGKGNGFAPYETGELGPDSQPDTNTLIERLLQEYTTAQVQGAAEQQTLAGVRKQIEEQVAEAGFAASLDLRQEERGLVVTVVTDQVLFPAGSAVIQPAGLELLAIIGAALSEIDNDIFVEGHTDSDPISTAQFPSNWELSGARASAVVRYFETLGLERDHMHVEGFGDTQPVASNATAEGKAKNRRVVLIVESKLIESTLDEANLGHDEVDLDDVVDRDVDTSIDLPEPQLGLGIE